MALINIISSNINNLINNHNNDNSAHLHIQQLIENSNSGLYPEVILPIVTNEYILKNNSTIITGNIVNNSLKFIVPYFGVWNICNLNQNVISSIEIDTVKQYKQDIFIQKKKFDYLYFLGDECANISGGWSIKDRAVKNTSSLYLQGAPTNASTDNHHAAHAFTNSSFDIRDKVYLGVYYTQGSAALGTTSNANKPFNIYSDFESENRLAYYTSNFSGWKIYDIKNLSSMKLHFYLNTWKSINSYCTAEIDRIVLFQEDDLQQLNNIAKTAYGSITDALNASSTLLGNKTIVQLLACEYTGSFMAQALNSSTFLNALKNSPYKNILLENEYWKPFLSRLGVN